MAHMEVNTDPTLTGVSSTTCCSVMDGCVDIHESQYRCLSRCPQASHRAQLAL